MDKQTLSNYGWIVITSLILAVMLAFATPFGRFAVDGISSTITGFIQTSKNAMSDDNKDKLANEWEGKWIGADCKIEGHTKQDGKTHGIAVTECNSGHEYTCQCSHIVAPENGIYYRGITDTAVGKYQTATHTYQAGEQLPCGYKPQQGDTFVSGQYEYRYCKQISQDLVWMDQGIEGWGVRVLDTSLSAYDDPIENILGKNVIHLNRTYQNCTNLVSAPKIPSNTYRLYNTYNNCTVLTSIPSIPETVTSMYGAFIDCKSLKTIPQIPESVTDLSLTFSGCKSMIEMPDIPSKVTSFNDTFAYCSNLKIIKPLPDSIQSMQRAFRSCTSLTTSPALPASLKANGAEWTFMDCKNLVNVGDLTKATKLTDMYNTFMRCAITETPVLPANLTKLTQTFSECTQLTKVNAIPSTVQEMSCTFTECTNLKDISNMVLPNGLTDLYWAFYLCESLEDMPVIPSSVKYMKGTFRYCYELKGTLTINANPSEIKQCFEGVDMTNITLSGSASTETKEALALTGKNSDKVTIK